MMHMDPTVDAEVDRALAMIEKGHWVAGESLLATLLTHGPDLPTVQFAMGVVRAQQQRYDEALAYFDHAIERWPDFVEAWFNKGVVHKAQLEVEDMLHAFEHVLALGHPADDCVQQAAQMVASFEQHLHEESGITLDAYLQAKALFDTAFAMMQQRAWLSALEGFQAVIALHPTHTQSYGNMGICYAYLGRKQEALAAFERALALDPHYAPALVNRRVVAALSEGETLPESGFGAVEYYRDAWLRRAEQRR
jgi:tetratricopeptide (TPR) repeat protein